jgi:PAS domain S-box-containing protein
LRVRAATTILHDVLDDAFEHAPVALLVLDAEGTVRHANRAFAALVGREELVGADARDLLAPGERDEPWADVRGRLATPLPFTTQRRWVRGDGALIATRVEGTLFADPAGAPSHAVVAVHRDEPAAVTLDSFRSAVARHVAQMQRYGAEGAVLAVDAPEGAVRQRMRASDIVGRTRGRTCVLLPRGGPAVAQAVAAALERAVGAPVGVAPFRDPDDADAAIARALEGALASAA